MPTKAHLIARVAELEEKLAEDAARSDSLAWENKCLRSSLETTREINTAQAAEIKRYIDLIDRLFERMPVEVSAPLPARERTPWAVHWKLTLEQEELLRAVWEGRELASSSSGPRINAIKLLRSMVGPENIGLKEAKDAIERRFEKGKVTCTTK